MNIENDLNILYDDDFEENINVALISKQRTAVLQIPKFGANNQHNGQFKWHMLNCIVPEQAQLNQKIIEGPGYNYSKIYKKYIQCQEQICFPEKIRNKVRKSSKVLKAIKAESVPEKKETTHLYPWSE